MSGSLRFSSKRFQSPSRLKAVQIDPKTGHVLVPGHERNRFRSARFRRFLTMVDAILIRQGFCRILDLGGTPAYWGAFDQDLKDRNIFVTVVNLLPQTSISPRMTCVIGDATSLADHPSMSFDIVHSNSVIEHVGNWSKMQAFAAEVARLAPAYFVQTPNFWFPFDPHARTLFFHWLPVRLRVALLLRVRCGFYPRARSVEEALQHVHDADCLTRIQVRSLFPDAKVQRERLFGATKSWMITRQ